VRRDAGTLGAHWPVDLSPLRPVLEADGERGRQDPDGPWGLLGAALHLGHPATHSPSAIHATSDHHGVANARGAAVLLGRPKRLWAIPPWAHPRCARFGNGCGCRPPRGRRVPPEPSLPPRCAAPGRRLNRAGVDRAAHDHPGNHRLRVPHLAGPKLIASPDGGRDLRDDVEHATSTILVGGQSPRTLYGFGNVRNISAAPKPDLVAKDPQSASHLLPTRPRPRHPGPGRSSRGPAPAR
jgi:hypothetical protein